MSGTHRIFKAYETNGETIAWHCNGGSMALDSCPNKPTECTECTAPRVSLNVNYGLWLIMMSQCRLTDCNKCPTLVGDIGCGEGRVRGAGNIWELPVLPIQCLCDPDTALKKKSISVFKVLLCSWTATSDTWLSSIWKVSSPHRILKT